MKTLMLLSFCLLAMIKSEVEKTRPEEDITLRLLVITNDIKECWKGGTPPQPSKNCNVFVGRAIKEIWGYDDFWNKGAGMYYSANDLYFNLIVNKNWETIGPADSQDNLNDAQNYANENKCVIASWFNPDGIHGHIALIIPGQCLSSPRWGLSVPNCASFSEDPNNQFIGDKLSRAFGTGKKSTTILYYHK